MLDELGSALRQMTGVGDELPHFGYDEFDQSLFEENTLKQPFGFTGYQSDEISELNYAQAWSNLYNK